ncbi:MAG: hypothetical protein MZU91_11550 [Desulfosudis oleivorans]|nr:hypothetical protein [Desulfosudis oleivorans]
MVWSVCSTRWPGRVHLSSSRDGAPEEVEPHERRLAALPGDRRPRRACVRLDRLPDVALHDLVGHPEVAARGRAAPSSGRSSSRRRRLHLRPGRLGHDVEGRGREPCRGHRPVNGALPLAPVHPRSGRRRSIRGCANRRRRAC